MVSLLRRIFYISAIVLLIAVSIDYYRKGKNDEQLRLLEEWSNDNRIKNVESVKADKFEIKFDEAEWDLLINKLNNTRYFNKVNENDAKLFELGFDVDYAKVLVDYWRTKFDWKKQIKALNQHQQYKIVLEDTVLHFMRVNQYNAKQNTDSKRIPLLLLSGWPGSFFEFYKAIDYINKNFNNDKRHFDIIVPSIPGFGYSTPLSKSFDHLDTARIYDALMRNQFGEDCKYFIHGEDWGSIIATTMAQMYPKRVSGVHTSMVSFAKANLDTLVYNILIELTPRLMLTESELKSNLDFTPLKRFKHLISITGYLHYQATKPDTLGFPLSDSPVGLMTYILEKYAFGSFGSTIQNTNDGKLETFQRDDLLTIVNIYWFTNSITSSMRIYKWVFNKLAMDVGWPRNIIDSISTPSTVPFAVMYAPNDIDRTPYCLLKRIFPNLLQYTILNTGGHFIAFQEPKLAMNDFIQFVDKALLLEQQKLQ